MSARRDFTSLFTSDIVEVSPVFSPIFFFLVCSLFVLPKVSLDIIVRKRSLKDFIIFLFLDKNTPNRDVDIPNADNHDPFTSWGKNPLESRNRDAEYFDAYMDKNYLFADKNDLNKDINILNMDILIPFLSGGKNAPVGGNHITDYYNTYQDKYVLFQCVIDRNKIECVPFVSYFDLNKSYIVPITSRADPYTDGNVPFPDGNENC